MKGRRAYLRAAVVVVALGAAAAAAQLRARARGHGPERPRRPCHTSSKLVLPVLAGVGCQSPGRAGRIRRRRRGPPLARAGGRFRACRAPLDGAARPRGPHADPASGARQRRRLPPPGVRARDRAAALLARRRRRVKEREEGRRK